MIFTIRRAALIKMRDSLIGVPPTTRVFHPQHLAARHLLNVVEKFLPIQCNMKLLDIGCGTKPYSHLREYKSWFGIDIVNSPGVDLVIPSQGPISLPEWDFDVVLCTQVLEHVKSPSDFIESMLDNLKDGALLLVHTPFIYPIHGEPYDFHRFTPGQYAEFFNRHEIIEIGQLGGFGTSSVTLLNNWINRSFVTWVNENPYLRNPIRLTLFPLMSLFYAISNSIGLILDRIDRTNAFPTNVYGIIRVINLKN